MAADGPVHRFYLRPCSLAEISERQHLMKILVLMAHDGALNFSSFAETSYSEYAKRHGYDYRCQKLTTPETGGPHPSWQKLAIIRKAIENDLYDWIFWVDTDSVVTNHAKAVDDIISIETTRRPAVWMIVSRDWGEGGSPWSAGVMLIKSCPSAIKFLGESEKQTQFMDSGCWDQSAMQRVCKENPVLNNWIEILPRRILQSVPKECSDGVVSPWSPGDFICHVTGIPNSQKRCIVERHFQRAMR